MKKNILIIFLLLIILILTIKVFNPIVVTSKNTANLNASDKSSKEVVTETTTEESTIKLEQNEISSSTDYGVPPVTEEEKIEIKQPIKVNEFERPKDINVYRNPQLQPYTAPVPKFEPNIKTKQEFAHKTPKTRLEESISVCKPYSEKMSAEYMGMIIDYELAIRGWINNKCVIDFVSNVRGIGTSFSKTYDIDPNDAQVFTFAPQIKCQFTKEQLLYVGDSILQEQERNNGATNNMLKNPNTVHLPQMQNISGSDARLLEVVIGNSACEMVNDGNFEEMVKDLFN